MLIGCLLFLHEKSEATGKGCQLLALYLPCRLCELVCLAGVACRLEGRSGLKVR